MQSSHPVAGVYDFMQGPTALLIGNALTRILRRNHVRVIRQRGISQEIKVHEHRRLLLGVG